MSLCIKLLLLLGLFFFVIFVVQVMMLEQVLIECWVKDNVIECFVCYDVIDFLLFVNKKLMFECMDKFVMEIVEERCQ